MLTRYIKACILQRVVASHYNTSYCIGQCTTVIRTALTSQIHKELASATNVYMLALCSLQQQVIHHKYGILQLLTYCVHREGDNSLNCYYNHRGLSFNSKFMGNSATSAVTINSVMNGNLHDIFQLRTVQQHTQVHYNNVTKYSW